MADAVRHNRKGGVRGGGRHVGDVEGALERSSELALAGRVLHQINGAGPHNVTQSGPRLGSERQHHGRNGSCCPQCGQAGHAGMAVEDRSGDEHVKGTELLDLAGNITHVGAGHDFVARTERGLNGPAEGGRAADDENPAAHHGAVAVWSVPMHCCSGGGFGVLLRLHDRQGFILAEELCVPRLARVHGEQQRLRGGNRPTGSALVAGVGRDGALDVEDLNVRHRQLRAGQRQRRGQSAVGRDLGDVGVDINTCAGLEIAGQCIRSGQASRSLRPCHSERKWRSCLPLSSVAVKACPFLTGCVSTSLDSPWSDPRSAGV